MLGSWSAQGRPEDVVTLRASLIQKLGADHVHYAKGSDITKASDEQLAEAVKAAQDSDIVILALGENASEMTGEAASRAHLGLPGRQQQLLEAIVATGKPVVLILFSGRPLTLPWAFEHVPAVLAAWFPGVQAGPALVRTLFGESIPSGKLPVTWPRAVGQEPLYYNALNTGRPAGNADLTKPPSDGAEQIYFALYRRAEQSAVSIRLRTHLYELQLRADAGEFSSIERQNIERRPSRTRNIRRTPMLTVSADITNTGTRESEETVQLYVRLEGTSTAQPIRALKGFQHVKLAAGETQRVSFRLGPDAFALWDDQNKYVVESARAKIWISPDSAHGSEATIEITK